MNLLNLAARVAHTFSVSGSSEMRTVQKVKNRQSRDVVTQLDMRLHEISDCFVAERLPGCRLLSEEGGFDNHNFDQLCKGQWLVVDPLDGSNNHAIGMSNYGFMATYLTNGYFEGVVVVLPEHDQYIVLESNQWLYAKPLLDQSKSELGSVYYAYPPRQDSSALQARVALQDLIDTTSAGLYRYGSACAGLYHLLCGKHMAFIGHGIRIWDALAFLPVLASNQVMVKYAINSGEITLVASKNMSFIESTERILRQHQGTELHNFHRMKLVVNAQ